MHRIRVALTILSLILYVARGVHAEEPGLKLRLQPELIPYSLGKDDPTDLFLEANEIRGREDRELDATGSVRLRKRGAALFADQVHLVMPDQEVTATGNVRLERDGDVISGAKLFYDFGDDNGSMDDASYRIARMGARGTARRLVAENRDVYHIDKTRFTNCEVGNDDWYMRIDRLDIDRITDVGTARNATVVFKGVPILYSPYLDFSLTGRRKTGLLPPTVGSTGKSGFEYTQPFYWNIAPNYDATIAPRVLAKRGVLMNTDFRYLEPDVRGEMRGEYLPEDRQKQESRYGYLWQHAQNFGNGFSGSLDLQGVSDDTYFTDLSDKIAATSQTNLNREGDLFYDGGWWSVNTRVQRYQTLQDPLAPVVPPYARLPQITLNMNRQSDYYLDFGLQGEYVEFSHPTLLNGRRQILYPSISAPFQNSYFYFTPKVGYHTTNYSFDDRTLPDQSRNLPIYSLDSGLTFERDANILGRAFRQTLEPRLYYVNIPFRPQNQLPNFDTALSDFNLAQIFTENQFTGGDRINDANQLTGAVTSRLIDPATGDEQMRFTLGQRYYFKDQEVALDPSDLRQSSRSDVLVAVTGQFTKRWYADAGVQYSTNDNKMERSNYTLRYQPDPTKVINFGYRFTRDTLEQLDLSTEWPITGRWTGLGRYNYSLRDKNLLEGLLGVEYNAGCWAARFVLHRFVSGTQDYVNAMFFQLEFTGVSRIGSSPLELLRQSIGGYEKTNPKNTPDYNPFPSF